MKKYLGIFNVLCCCLVASGLFTGCNTGSAPTTGDMTQDLDGMKYQGYYDGGSEAEWLIYSTSADDVKNNENIQKLDLKPGNQRIIPYSSLTPNTIYYYRALRLYKGIYGDKTHMGGVREFTWVQSTPPTHSVTLSPFDVNNVGSDTAICISAATVSNNGTIGSRGVCWSTSPSPDFNSNKLLISGTVGSFESKLSYLTPSTKYYVRAFIRINVADFIYSNQEEFTTKAATVVAVAPTVTTTAISGKTSTSAVSGGNVTNDGGASVTARGICWSKSANPTLSDSTRIGGAGTGSFSSNLSSLTASTTYHVRAYATNSAGTGYGDDVSFTTNAPLLQVGDVYQGGKIAYILKPGDPLYDANVQHGLIGATTDQTSGEWGCVTNNQAPGWSWKAPTDTAVGLGMANTDTLIAQYARFACTANPGVPQAFQVCKDLTLGGYSDWFLPSRNELEMLLLNNTYFNMSSGSYSSSSQHNWGGALLSMSLANMRQEMSWQTTTLKVRAVRYF